MHGLSIYWVFFLLLIAMTVWMFWQQSRQQRNRRQVQNSVALGDRVVTIGGMIGTVEDVSDNELTLRVADGVNIKVVKSSIGGKYSGGLPR